MMDCSFIVPVFNCKPYIKTCVDLIAHIQNHCTYYYEIILVDDGSTDGSSLVCDQLKEDNISIKVIHQKNHGVSHARNAGLKAASGKYVVFLDADDRIFPDKLAEIINRVLNSSEIDLTIFGSKFDYYAGKKISRSEIILPPLNGLFDIEDCINHLDNLYKTNCLSAVWNKIIRRDLLIDNSLYFREDMFLYEDLDFSIKLLRFCRNVLFVPEPVYIFRQNEGGHAGMRLKRIKNVSSLITQLEEAFQFITVDGKQILLPLFEFLAIQKSYVSNKNEIICICKDFIKWVDQHDLSQKVLSNPSQSTFYNLDVSTILTRKRIRLLKNRIGNFLKVTGIYQILRKQKA